jgi:cytoskeletal protein RodZ
MTLQDIASTTKIGTRTLQALEEERFEQLPGGIFNKGFVRSYARSVGLDEDKTVAAYLEAAKATLSETDMQALSSQVSASRQSMREPWVFNARAFVGVLAVIVAVVMGGLWLKEHLKEIKQTAAAQVRTESPAVNPAPPVTVPVQPNVVAGDPNAGAGSNQAPNDAVPNSAVQNGVANNAANRVDAAKDATGSTGGSASAASASPVEVSISATSRAWISVRSDGKQVETLTLDPEKPDLRARSYRAKEKLMLVVGNPAGLSVTYNGKPTGTLGTEGHRATITFTPGGMQKQ